MTPKDMLTNKSFCPLPWTGFYADISGEVKNCICSYESIGNLKNNSIEEILSGPINTQVKQDILANKKPFTCSYCYSLEENKASRNIVSSRVYYLKQLKTVDPVIYQNPWQFNLHQVDVRWTNTCNFACVYCGPVLSSKWAEELKVRVEQPSVQQLLDLKNFIFNNAHQLKNIYMAGGEPLLMKQNAELLKLLLVVNPDIELRINTNLSKTDTEVMELICQFKNVHWTLSAESIDDKFAYMRYGGNWNDFVENIKRIQVIPTHRLTFNMVWCVLNHTGIFECIDYFLNNGFHPNSFILTAILGPDWLDTRHLPDHVLQSLEQELESRIKLKPGFLLEDGYRNLLKHVRTPFSKNLKNTLDNIRQLDQRRNINSTKIFTDLYKEINHGQTI
jgi:MoaA/NifB/PqqE/SkfB family radical SAM enzyme